MLPTTASLIDQSLWRLVPYAGLILLMVYAMMECTVTLLQRPPTSRKPVAGDELRRRLLDRHTLLVLIGVSAIWWGVWDFLVWALGGFPAFWRRTRRER